MCRDKFPKLPRSLAIMSAISGDGVGYRHEGNLKRRTGGINTTSIDELTINTATTRPMRVLVFFFFFSRDGRSPLAFGAVGERSIDFALRLFRDCCLTMRIKGEINAHSAKCDHMFLQLANYRASKASEC